MEKHWTDITEKEFINAYNSYPPNGWIRFVFNHFSKADETKDIDMNNIVTGILIGLFGVGFLGSILNWSISIIKTVTIAYAIILGCLGILLFGAVFMNNRRIKKIANELNVTLKEYNFLVKRYF